MANRTKIGFLGATSMSFGLSVLRDIFASNELHGSTLTLVGRNPATLAKMTELAKLSNNKPDTDHRIHYRSPHSFRWRRICCQRYRNRSQSALEAGFRSAAQIRG